MFWFHFTPLLLLWAGFSWWGVALCAASYALRMFGVTAGYHRLFSHRSFKTGRVMQFLFAFLAQTSLQQGVLWWASHHRHHHWHSDKPTDVHSPVQHGFLYAHIGWIFADAWQTTDEERVRDLAKYPELRWLDRYHMVPGILYALALYLAFGFHGLVWGFFVSTVLLWHGTFTINSLSHVFGRRVYPTTDTSKNNWLLAVVTLGEGWHNNHHHFQRSCAQGWRWYELDITYLTLKVLSWFRLVSNVTKPPQHVIEKTISNMRTRADELELELAALRARLQAALGGAADNMQAAFHGAAESMQHKFSDAADNMQAAFHGAAESMQHKFSDAADNMQAAFHEAIEAMRKRCEELEAEIEELRRRAMTPAPA